MRLRSLFERNAPEIVETPAYHGTPHQFDRFNMDQIGTGEGNQAYGWGLYFAGARDVANFYRMKLSRGLKYRGRRINVSGDYSSKTMDAAVWAVFLSDGDKEQAKRSGLALPDKIDAVDVTQIQPIRGGGRLYSVDIPDDSEFLLWDSTMAEQSPDVQEKLRTIHRFPSDRRGETIYTDIVLIKGSPKAASLALLAAGIPGIKYLDGNSRNNAAGTYNYVIFDVDRISISGVE